MSFSGIWFNPLIIANTLLKNSLTDLYKSDLCGGISTVPQLDLVRSR